MPGALCLLSVNNMRHLLPHRNIWQSNWVQMKYIFSSLSLLCCHLCVKFFFFNYLLSPISDSHQKEKEISHSKYLLKWDCYLKTRLRAISQHSRSRMFVRSMVSGAISAYVFLQILTHAGAVVAYAQRDSSAFACMLVGEISTERQETNLKTVMFCCFVSGRKNKLLTDCYSRRKCTIFAFSGMCDGIWSCWVTINRHFES